MKNRKYILCTALLYLAFFSAFASDWYICLGSFKDFANAQQFKEELDALSIPSFVYKTENAEQTLYRVLLPEAFSNADDARKLCKGIEKPLKKHIAINGGLWICEAEVIPQDEIFQEDEYEADTADEKMTYVMPQDEVLQKDEYEAGAADEKVTYAVPQGEILQMNEDRAIPVSEEKPFSLKVRSYKEEHPAQQNSERLRKHNINAYVVKTYDDDAYFSFDVHAGAFATPEESAETEQVLAALGIDNVALSDYTDIKDKMQRYNEVVQQGNVVFETAENAVMPEFSDAVRTCLANLPVNKHFLIESITIVDFETLAVADGFRAFSKAVYLDDLLGKRVEVFIIERAEPLPNTDFAAETQFSLPNGDALHARILSDGTTRTVEGMNADRTLLIKINAHNFSDDDLSAFMNNAWSDNVTVIYPQLRKSLCVLPKYADNRRFVAFTLSHLDQSYAVSKNYVNWALPRVGHWIAKGHFLQNNEEIWVDFFDMDYEHNAQKIDEMFMDEKKNYEISDSNHPITINGTNAWYGKYSSRRVKQIGFSIKSFRVVINTPLNSSIDEDDLHDFAADLLVWEQ